MRQHKPALIVISSLMILSACSSDGSLVGNEPLTNRPTATTIAGTQLSAEPIPPPELDADLTGDDLLVAIEARWMCDVQRFAFPDLNAMNAALDERLDPHGLTRADYGAFKAQMETRVDLRQQVLAAYSTVCG